MQGRNEGLKLYNPAEVTPQELAALGGGHIAYVKPMLSEDINRVFPNAPQLEPGIKLYALLSADGSPIMLTDSRDAAYAGAYEHELATVSVH